MSENQALDQLEQNARSLKKGLNSFLKDVSDYKKEEKTRTSSNSNAVEPQGAALGSPKKNAIDAFIGRVKDVTDDYITLLSGYMTIFNQHEVDSATYKQELKSNTDVAKTPELVQLQQKRANYEANSEALVIGHRGLTAAHRDIEYVVNQICRTLPKDYHNPVKRVNLKRPPIAPKVPKVPSWGVRYTKQMSNTAIQAALAKMFHSS
jgi:hypothetical protein